jgi:hypothetical protein
MAARASGNKIDVDVSGLERLAPACLVHSGCASRFLGEPSAPSGAQGSSEISGLRTPVGDGTGFTGG